jgi:urease accessory protein
MMKTGHRILPSIAAACILTPVAALAHTGAGGTSGFLHGFLHPLVGVDHLLAMVMVGLLAYQLGGRAIWLLPVTFVAIMALGSVMGIAGVTLPMVETAIALSVIVLGLVVASAVKAPSAAVMALVAFFAVFHGHAHGTEMPMDAGGLVYGAGFALATALLHLAGLGVGALIGRLADRDHPVLVRSAGAIAAVAGGGILAGVL